MVMAGDGGSGCWARLGGKMGLLEDKVIVIGGVGEGIGHSMALRAAAQGAKVILAARTVSRVEAYADEVKAAGGVAIPVRCDMSSLADCRNVAQAAVERFGRIDGVSMVACMEPDRKFFADADDDFADWRPIVDFNVFGTLQLVKACLKSMSRGGSVAIVGSQAQDEPWERTGPYAAAKAGLGAMIRVMALEYGPKGIRFNGMAAGGIASGPYFAYLQQLADFAGRTLEEQKALMQKDYPLGYVPPPEEYADALIFLMSDMSRAVNGQNIHVNGGIFMKS
jgi:NAD(P)-dependent dehydrogenase (short-subunit alcohol dehydrogenase family)